MNKLFTLTAALFLCASAFAQSPESISYQAVIRDANNSLISTQTVTTQISILQGSVSGEETYVETHILETNSNGLVSLEIGSGTAVFGDFSAIDWSDGPFFIKTETDPQGGSDYSITGVSQIMSVPYALHSKTAESIVGGIEESDPLFTLWDKSSGIMITQSQISDLTQLTEVDVDAFVANNGYLTEESEMPADAADGDMSYFNGEVWTKLAAPANDEMLLSYCYGKPTWTTNGKCTFVGAQTQGGIVYKIFQPGDAGYVAGEVHGMAASATQGQATIGASGELYGTLNAGEYSDWMAPTIGQLNEITAAVGASGFFSPTFHWTVSFPSSGQAYAQNLFTGNQVQSGWNNQYSILGVREF